MEFRRHPAHGRYVDPVRAAGTDQQPSNQDSRTGYGIQAGHANQGVGWGGGMSNGKAHDRFNPPAVMVGGANGRMKGNRQIVAKHTPTANLLLALPHVGAVEIETAPASTGRIDL